MADFKTINIPVQLHEELKRLAEAEAKRLHLPSLSLASLIARMKDDYKV